MKLLLDTPKRVLKAISSIDFSIPEFYPKEVAALSYSVASIHFLTVVGFINLSNFESFYLIRVHVHMIRI